ncbi:MAG: GNAT family N-acetyltransferase [Candidatus Promineifilaceae bacterium]|jgi:RimJ/RimL family protein N-acetyltransferase
MSEENTPYWQGKLVRLRPMRPDDRHKWLADEQTDADGVRMLNAGMTLPASEHEARSFVQRYAHFNNRQEHLMFSIDNLEGELVGGINLHSMDQKNGTFEVGSRIYRAYRGRGYFFDAKLLILRYAFYELRYQKYECYCHEQNEAMVRHLERLGCTLEGRLRRHIYTNGRYYDELAYGLTREEFDELLARQ